MKTVLHVGTPKLRGKKYFGPGFQGDEWREIRLDLDPYVEPDILASITDMKAVGSGSVDAVFTSHTVEHLFPDDVKLAFEECLRVLKPEGILVLACPDLQSAAAEVAKGNLLGTLYESDEGPIAAIDIIYSFRGYLSIKNRREYMAHRTGFILPVLLRSLEAVGFAKVVGRRRESSYDIWTVASKSPRSDWEMEALASAHIPSW